MEKMLILAKGDETKILEILETIKNNHIGYYGLHFHLSKLEVKNQNSFQLRVAMNIIKDFFKTREGCITHFQDNDLIVIFESEERSLIEKIIFQLRYLFIDDPLAFEAEGIENYKFCNVYMLSFQWRDFYLMCNKKLQLSAGKLNNLSLLKECITPNSLNFLLKKLDETDISNSIRAQYIYGYNSVDHEYKPIYREIFISISSLREQLQVNFDIIAEKNLFRYLTQVLDFKLLDLLIANPSYLTESFSINLNISSLFSDRFTRFVELLKNHTTNTSIIIELQISDIFEDFQSYLAARDFLKLLDFKISIDGLTDAVFLQISREALGADLIKIRWSPESLSLNNDLYIKDLEIMVEKTGMNRIVLCRCDDAKAIEFGQVLGIKLFQGWYMDKMLKNKNLHNFVNKANISI